MYNLQNVFAEEQIIQVLKSLKGPFSIVYYSKSTHNLFFTRDRIGRNTLLFHKGEDSIVISSTLGNVTLKLLYYLEKKYKPN